MSSLVNTDLAAASTGSNSHLFYQQNSKIIHTQSGGGNTWTVETTPVGEDAKSSGAAITAYYVEKDANFSKKPTVGLYLGRKLGIYCLEHTTEHILLASCSVHGSEWLSCREGEAFEWGFGKLAEYNPS